MLRLLAVILVVGLLAVGIFSIIPSAIEERMEIERANAEAREAEARAREAEARAREAEARAREYEQKAEMISAEAALHNAYAEEERASGIRANLEASAYAVETQANIVKWYAVRPDVRFFMFSLLFFVVVIGFIVYKVWVEDKITGES